MTISATRLSAALRAKFKTPRAALAALGLDQDLLTPGGSNTKPVVESMAPVIAGRDDEDAGKVMTYLANKLDPATLRMVMQKLGVSGMDDADEHADLRRYLKARGASESEIDQIIRAGEEDLADLRAARDEQLTKNALRPGLRGGGGFGGRLGAGRAGNTGYDAALAYDEERENESLRKMFGDHVTEIKTALTFNNGVPERPTITEAQQRDFFSIFPDAERIG